jgi:hypothetical protein
MIDLESSSSFKRITSMGVVMFTCCLHDAFWWDLLPSLVVASSKQSKSSIVGIAGLFWR